MVRHRAAPRRDRVWLMLIAVVWVTWALLAGRAQAGGAGQVPQGVDGQAPVIVQRSLLIRAPLDVLWRLHTGVNDWPAWQPDIKTARLNGSFAPGSTFKWLTAGLDVTSTIYQVEPRERTLWGGESQGIMGIHEWTFTPVPGGVRVTTTESFSGQAVEADAANLRRQLARSLEVWLQHLQTEAARR